MARTPPQVEPAAEHPFAAPLRPGPRRPHPAYRADTEDAWRLFRRARVAHVAFTDREGAPVLRALHPVVIDDAVCFHGGRSGEKTGMVGRAVVVSVDEQVARVPSHFVDPELACPATTYYRSAMAWGVAEAVEDLAEKARILAGLMGHHQPEGLHAPVSADDPRYVPGLRGVAVIRVRPTRLEGRFKLHQQRPVERMTRVLEGLWRRGAPGDVEAIEAIVAAHPGPLAPAFLRAPRGRFVVAPDEDDLARAVDLVEDAYWNEGLDRRTVERGHQGSSAWLVIREGDDVLATGRAVADGKNAWLYDVAVRADLRGRGLGTALVTRLLDHPAVRRCGRVFLGTRDAQAFYARLGFAERERPFTVMVRPAGM